MTLSREDIDGVIFIHNYQGDMDVDESRSLIASLGELIGKVRKTDRHLRVHNRR